MECRRGSITQWDERRIEKLIGTIDESAEGQTAKHAMRAFWNRDYAAYDAAAECILSMKGIDNLPSVFTNFSFLSLYALNPDLGSRFSRQSFEAGGPKSKLLRHSFEHAWAAADIELCNMALAQMEKLKLNIDSTALLAANRLLERAGVSFEEYHEYIHAVSQLVRSYLNGRTDVRFSTFLSVDEHEDGHEEILYEIDLGLDDETLDRLDEELLSLQSNPERVRPALNKCVGVLVRDYPKEAGAEAC